MKAKLIRMEGTVEAEGTPAELAQLFKDFCGTAWSLQSAQITQGIAQAGTLTGGVAGLQPSWPTDGVKGLVHG